MDAELRRIVRQRAEERCEYCRLPGNSAPFLTFHVEHVQSQQHIDDDSLENLALACPDCNRHKGPNLTSIDPVTRDVVPLFHPRKDCWSDHFRLDGATIVGLTPTGVVTARLLNMNSPERIRIRELLIGSSEY